MGYDDYVGFGDWRRPALIEFGAVAVVCAVIGTAVSALISVVRYGPGEAFYKVWEGLFRAVPDVLRISPRRVGAIAKLAIQETLRRRVMLVAFAIFAIALLFGGWFLDSGSDHPERTYLGFVLTGTQFLVLFMGLLISTFSLPQDILNRTIYTVVTKPVRSSEIVLGRIVGFTGISTVLLAAMGLISWAFVVTGLEHGHAVDTSEFVRIEPDSVDTPSGRRASDNAYYELQTRREAGHRHRVELQALEQGSAEGASPGQGLAWATFAIRAQFENGHRHDVVLTGVPAEGRTLDKDGLAWTVYPDGGIRVEVREGLFDRVETILDSWPLADLLREAGAGMTLSGPVDVLQARKPLYASELTFLDREGAQAREGVNVGKSNEKFSYIDGGASLSRAIYRFPQLSGSDFPEDRFRLDLSLRVFRTLKGEITRRVTGSIVFRVEREEDGRKIEYTTDPLVFESQEYAIQTLEIPRTVTANWVDVEGNPVRRSMDLFDEFAAGVPLEIVLKCNESGQYFGVSSGSVYFKLGDGSFFVNFFKCYIGIWCQLLLVTSLGVALSTFLNASVSLLATISGLCVGFFGKFIRDLAAEQLEGGGPVEATYRLITQRNLTGDIENDGLMRAVDAVLLKLMEALTYVVPDFTLLDTQAPLADGYDIPLGLVAAHLAVALTFAICTTLLGYFTLRTREIAG